jgi:FlaA1/EpsC-like NDP-sugar epimerase
MVDTGTVNMRVEDVAALLGRGARSPDMRPAREFVRGKTVLVTGAGGSIGSELCREVVAMGSRKLIALEHSDHALIDLQESLGAIRTPLVDVLCDVRDAQRLSAVFERTRPDVVIHAAALKHVHMGERHPGESVLTNLVGVRNAVEAAAKAGVDHFLLISSDKAAAPGSVMGASKRLAELYLRGVGATSKMRTLAVRFGNVFGSKGSVAPLFARQIASGGPITITHPDMRRYFMTVQEAVQLILLVLARGGEESATYLLDMGEPVKIMDIARRMIAQANAMTAVEITGLREGEKLDEELYDDFEEVEPAGIDGVQRIRPTSEDFTISGEDIAEIERVVRTKGDDIVRHRVFALLDGRLEQGVSDVG